MTTSVSIDLIISHSALRFLFRSPKKWTRRHLDTLRIQEHENTSVTKLVGETNLPTNDEPAYRLLTPQITLHSRGHILNKADSESWLNGKIFDAIHRLAKTPEGKTPSEALFDGILNVMTFWYRWHYAEAKNVWSLRHGFHFHLQTCRVRGGLKCDGVLGSGIMIDGGGTVPTVGSFHPLIIYNTVKKPEAENRMKREIPFGLFIAFAAFDRMPTQDQYTSFVFNLRRTSVQVTKIVAARSYLRALCEGREASEHLDIYRPAEYDLVEPDGREEFLTLFLGAMKHSLRQFGGRVD